MLLPGTTDLERAVNEFMEINWSLEKSRDERKFEGGVLAQVIADKLNELSPEERHKWIMTILAYLAEATNIAYRKGAEE